MPLLARALALLSDYHIKHAFEHFYVALKKAQITTSSVKRNDHLIAQLYDIFLNAERGVP